MGESPHPPRAPYNSAFVRCFAVSPFPSSPTYVRGSSAWGEKKRRQKEDHRAWLIHPILEGGCPLGKRHVPFSSLPTQRSVTTRTLGLSEVYSRKAGHVVHHTALLRGAERGHEPGLATRTPTPTPTTPPPPGRDQTPKAMVFLSGSLPFPHGLL